MRQPRLDATQRAGALTNRKGRTGRSAGWAWQDGRPAQAGWKRPSRISSGASAPALSLRGNRRKRRPVANRTCWHEDHPHGSIDRHDRHPHDDRHVCLARTPLVQVEDLVGSADRGCAAVGAPENLDGLNRFRRPAGCAQRGLAGRSAHRRPADSIRADAATTAIASLSSSTVFVVSAGRCPLHYSSKSQDASVG